MPDVANYTHDFCRTDRCPRFCLDPQPLPHRIAATESVLGEHVIDHNHRFVADTILIVEVTAAASRLIFSLETSSEPRNREIEAEKAKERAKARFG